MSRAKAELDLMLSIGGKGALKGALTPEDLEDLADLLKGLKNFDPSLQNIRMVGSIKMGSAVIGCEAPQPVGLMNLRPARIAAKAFFLGGGYDDLQGWTWPAGPRHALDRLTKRDRSLGVTIPPSHDAEKPFKTKLDRKDYERFAQKIAPNATRFFFKGTRWSGPFLQKRSCMFGYNDFPTMTERLNTHRAFRRSWTRRV